MFSDPNKNIEQLSLKLGSQVADFGSGSGHYSIAIARAVGDKGKVYAVDIQNELLTKLKKEARSLGFSNIEIIWGDVEKMGGSRIRDGFVDSVVVSNLLFQAKDRDSLANEAARILKQGGQLLVVDWTDSFEGLGPHTDQVFNEDSAKALFESKGFVYDRKISAGAHHYGVVFRKG
jgi:ubiquinone/menaquinone biosynthesis C-methylase UbiE